MEKLLSVAIVTYQNYKMNGDSQCIHLRYTENQIVSGSNRREGKGEGH